MSDAPKKAAKRLIKWRDSARRQLSTASCNDDLASALQFVLRNAAKTFRAVLLSPDDDQLSRDLNDVLCHVSSHLYLRSRSLLADRSSRFDYWAHQCAVLSYLLDLSLVRDDPGAFTKICFVLSKNKHAVWDVLVQTSAISSASDPQSKLVDLFRRFAAYCPRTCASAELYFKFVVCAACLARRLPERGWKTVKPVVLSIEPAEFDFEAWFSAQPALVALLPRSEVPTCRGKVIARLCKSASDPSELLEACRTVTESGCGGIRTTCDAAAAAEVDMFLIADEVVPEREQEAKVAEIEDEHLQAILDATLSRLQSNIATPCASDAEPNSEVISGASNSPLNTRVFLDRLLRNSAGDTGDGEVLKNAESPTKRLGSGQQESVEGVSNSEENEVVAAALAKGYEHASVAQETSEGEGRAENYADGTPTVSRPRKKRRKRRRFRKARASSKLHGTAEANDKLTASKTAEESDASTVSTDDEVQQKTHMSSRGNMLRQRAHESCSLSTARDLDAVAMLNSNRHGVKKTKQDGVNEPEEKSCKHSDAKIDDEASLNSIERPPYPLSSQEEPVMISVKEALSQCYGTGESTLSVDAGDSLSSSCLEVESTTGSGLLRACQTQKLTTRHRIRITEPSTEESCGKHELSSDTDVQNLNAARTLNGDQCGVKATERDDRSDHEEMLRGHRDSKSNAKTSSTKGRTKHGGHTDDSTESFSSSSDNEVVEKTGGQATSDNAAEALSSVSDAEVAAVTLSKSYSESSGQHLPLTPVAAGDVAAASTMKKARRSRIVVSSESSDEEHTVKHSALEAEPARAVKKAHRSRTFISSESSDEDHSNEHFPLQKAESTDEEDVVEDLEQEAESSVEKGSVKQSAPQEAKSSEKRRVAHSAQRHDKPARTVKKAHRSRTLISSESSDEDNSVEKSALQEPKSAEEHYVEHSKQREDEPARTFQKARRSRTLIFSESSDEDHIVKHSPLHKAQTSNEEGTVNHSAQKAESSDEEGTVKHSAQQEVKPARTVRKTRRSKTLISSESSVEGDSVEHLPLERAKGSDEEGSVEHSAQQEVKPARTVKNARRSKTSISSESSVEDDSVEHLPLQRAKGSDEEGNVEHLAQKAESSDEEGSVEHSAQQEVKPARTVKKTRRSKTLISSESSVEDDSVEHLPLQRAKGSDEEGSVEHSAQKAESSDEEGSVEHSAQQKVKPARTVKKTRRSKILISSESSVEDDSVEHLPLQRAKSSDEEGSVEHSAQKAESSDEEGSIEHSAQQEVNPARTVKKTRRSKTLISSESSVENDSVEHLPLQRAKGSDEECSVEHSARKAESSDEEGSIEHSAQQKVKPARTVKKAGRSKTVISSESSDEDHSAEHLPQQKAESSNEKGIVQLSAQEAESSDEENGVRCSSPQKAVPSGSGSIVGHPAQQAKSSDKEVSVKHSATQEESSCEKGSVEDSALQEAESSDGEGSVDHSTQQDAEFSDKCSIEHLVHPQPGQPAVFSEMTDEIPCGQRSPCASSLLDMHLSPPESGKDNSLSPVIQGSHPAAESDADTLEIQSNDEGVASCRQRASCLSQATTLSVSSQRRSPSPFSKLREMVMSFEEDSDDETDAVDFRRKKASAILPQSPFKLPLVERPGTSAVCKSVKSNRQDGRCSSDERNSPSKSQPARRRVRSRGSVSPQVKQRAMSDKRKVSASDSDSADAATSDTASVSLSSSVMGSRNVSAAKTEDLSPGNKKASTRRSSPRTSLLTNESSKLPEANKTSESERNGASGLDSDECKEDENKPLVSGKQTRGSPANIEKVVTVKTSLPNRRKDTPHPQPLASDLALREKAVLKLSSSHDSDGESVSVNKESASSKRSRQSKDNARQPLKSAVSIQRLSTRSCARRLAFGQQKEVCESNSSSICRNVNGQTVQSSDLAKSLSTGVERQDDSKNAILTPQKPCAPAKRSSGHLAHRIEASTRPGDLSDNGIEDDAPLKHPCPKSPREKAVSFMIKQKPGIETVDASTSRTGQLASGSGHRSSPSPIRGKTPAYGVNKTVQAKRGVFTRSARRQLSFAMDETSLSKEGRTTRSSNVVGPDVKSGDNSGDTTTKSRLREDIEPPPLKVRRRVLQDSINDGDSVSNLQYTQGEEAITEKESENENKGVRSPSPTVTKWPAITVGHLQNNETESAATVSGNRNIPRTRSVLASLRGREKVQVPSTTYDVSHACKQQLERSNTGHIAGLSRSPLRTPSKRRRVAEAGANVTPALETAEHGLPQTNDSLGGLTQMPLLRNVNASSDSLSSNEEKEFVRAARWRTQSLRRLPSRRCSQRNNKEDFIIDVDAMVRSFSDSDDDDPSYEARETNLDASIARLKRLKVPLYALQEEQSRPLSGASSYKVASTSARRTGRLSLTAIRASQSENSASTQSSRSTPFSPGPTTSSVIVDAQSPTSNFCTCQIQSRRTRSCGSGGIDAAMENQAEQDVQSRSQSKVAAPPVQTDTAMSAEKTPVLRRSTRVSRKRDTSAWPTRFNHLTSEVPAAATRPSHPSKDLDVVTQEQTSRATKRSKNSKMSPALKTHAEPPDESLNAVEQESVTDKASSAICSTCNRCVNAPSTQDSGTMTDDSYLHDEDAFSDSARYSKRRKTGGHSASVSRPKAGAARSSCRHSAASKEASVPVRRSSRTTAGALRRLSYT